MDSNIKPLSAPCTLSYNDDGQLLSVDIPTSNTTSGACGYTFTSNNCSAGPGGAVHPFSSIMLYNSAGDFINVDSVRYEFRTGPGVAVVTIGSPDKPNSPVVISNHRGIKGSFYDSNQGKWAPKPPVEVRHRL